MKISELSFADLTALREHAKKQIFETFSPKGDEAKKRSERNKQEQERWGKIYKMVAKEIYERTKVVEP